MTNYDRSNNHPKLNYYEIQLLKKSHVKWAHEANVDVFGTLKFQNGRIMHETHGDKLLSIFWNKVDRAYFGANGIRDGHRITRLVFKHFGKNDNNLHYHFVAKAEGQIFPFINLLKNVWKNVDYQTCSSFSYIEAIQSQEKATYYCAKECKKLGNDTILPDVCHTQTQDPDIKRFKGILRTRRLLKATY